MRLPQTPEEIPAQFAAAWMNRDAEALAALFVEDADFVNVVGLWWHNRADIQRAHAYGLRVIFDQSTLRAGGIRTRSLGEGYAVVHCRWHLTGQRDPAGELLGERTAVMVFVAEQTPLGWQVVTAQNTDVIPGSETLGIGSDGVETLNYQKR